MRRVDDDTVDEIEGEKGGGERRRKPARRRVASPGDEEARPPNVAPTDPTRSHDITLNFVFLLPGSYQEDHADR